MAGTQSALAPLASPHGGGRRPGAAVEIVRIITPCVCVCIQLLASSESGTGGRRAARNNRRRYATHRGLDGGEDGDGEVAAEVGVGDEAAEEAEHEGGADEVGDGVGGGGIAEVHGAGHVRHQVHRDAQRRHPLEQLNACAISHQGNHAINKLSAVRTTRAHADARTHHGKSDAPRAVDAKWSRQVRSGQVT